MRCPRLSLVLLLFSACGGDPAVAPIAAPTAAPTTPVSPTAEPAHADPGLAATATRILEGTATPSDHERAALRASDTVGELLAAAAATTDVAARGRAPGAIQALGISALPGLAKGLANQDVTQRRIAAMTLLQWSDALHAQQAAAPIVAALAEARADADPAVRAAAEHAYRRATGDTTALDRSRSSHDQAERNGR